MRIKAMEIGMEVGVKLKRGIIARAFVIDPIGWRHANVYTWKQGMPRFVKVGGKLGLYTALAVEVEPGVWEPMLFRTADIVGTWEQVLIVRAREAERIAR